jgi:hypothetical protein
MMAKNRGLAWNAAYGVFMFLLVFVGLEGERHLKGWRADVWPAVAAVFAGAVARTVRVLIERRQANHKP